MGLIINHLGIRTDDQIKEVRKSLVKLIVTTLEKSILFPIREQHIAPTEIYDKFVKLIKDDPRSSSIITFNYDIALDYALYYNNMNYDYCINAVSTTDTIKLLKLHGSVNWALCKVCSAIVPFTFMKRYNRSLPSVIGRIGGSRILFDELIKRSEHVNCNGNINSGCEDIPVIVPPTWNKKDYHGNLTNVWKYAAKELQETLIFTSSAILYLKAIRWDLFSLGSFDNASIKRFWVYNPDDSQGIKSRYSDLIGKGISDRFKYEAKTLKTQLKA